MDIARVKFDDRGLVPVIAQDAVGGAVLMLAYANAEALQATASTGFAHFYSRSRGRQWMKGETSGNRMAVREVRLDCDGDTVLYACDPEGPTCHTGSPTCFTDVLQGSLTEPGTGLLGELEQVLRGRLRDSDEGSYTAKLLQGDPARIRRKVSEEAFETILASEKNDTANLAEEVADLWFHTLVLLVRHGLGVGDVMKELDHRRGKRRVPGTKDLVVVPEQKS